MIFAVLDAASGHSSTSSSFRAFLFSRWPSGPFAFLVGWGVLRFGPRYLPAPAEEFHDLKAKSLLGTLLVHFCQFVQPRMDSRELFAIPTSCGGSRFGRPGRIGKQEEERIKGGTSSSWFVSRMFAGLTRT